MKKIITFIATALFAWCVRPVQAQVFDFDAASDFYLIWLDENSELYWEITPRIALDLRPNGEYVQGGNRGERFIDIWPAGESYTVHPAIGKGYLDQTGGYLNCTANNLGWAGGGFRLAPQPDSPAKADFTELTDDYRFHIAVKKTNTAPCRINLFGGGTAAGAPDDNQCAQFAVGVGNQVYNDPPIPNLTPDFKAGEWMAIDIPVAQLWTMGWNNRAAFTGYYFTYDFGSTQGNDLAMDAIFYYKRSSTGIVDPKAGNQKLNVRVTNKIVEVFNATAPIEVYDVAGIRVATFQTPVFGVDKLNPGAYIIQSGSAVAKIMIR